MEKEVDLDTITYRQDFLEEIIDLDLTQEIGGVGRDLIGLSETAKAGYGGLVGCQTLRDMVEGYKPVKDSKSEGFVALNAFFKDLKESREYTTLVDYLDEVGDSNCIDFSVTLDGNRPNEIFGIQLNKRTKKEIKGAKELGTVSDGRRGMKPYFDASITTTMENLCTKYLEELAGEHFSSIPTEGFKSLGLALSAYASFSEKMDNGFVRPTVLPKESRRMNVKNARNPLVENPVPNDIVYDGEQNLFLITGPNNGGKTTYVKSVGIVQALAQAGLFVPADQAEVSLVDNLYTHFVSPDDITKGEGRYKNELRRMDNIFENATPYSMVLLDEPCGGTSHEEGVEQSKNLLEGFDTLGCATYFTTHMHSLADEVKKDTYESARNFHAQCKKKLIGGGIKYTYKIVPGASGKSYGKEIADEMGLSSKDIKNTIRRNARENEFTNLLRGE